MSARGWLLAGLLAASALGPVAAHADDGASRTLRLATVAPEGTAWARELKAFARDVSAQTSRALEVKWYLGGIAGDDVQVADRIKRDQLDGVGSGGMLCERISPIMRAMHAVVATREEAFYVMNRSAVEIADDFKKSGFIFLGGAGLGPDVLFTRAPVRTVADLRANKLWVWDLDDVMSLELPAYGVQSVRLPMSEAGRAYDEAKISGFVALPTAVLAFQWSAQARYVTDLRMGFVTGCVILSTRAYDTIPVELRDPIRSAAAKLQQRMQDLGEKQDAALLGGLFARQGLTPTPVSAQFRSEYQRVAHDAQARLGDKLAPRAEIDKVLHLIEEYHSSAGKSVGR